MQRNIAGATPNPVKRWDPLIQDSPPTPPPPLPLPPPLYTLYTIDWHQKGLFSRISTLNRSQKVEIRGADPLPPSPKKSQWTIVEIIM